MSTARQYGTGSIPAVILACALAVACGSSPGPSASGEDAGKYYVVPKPPPVVDTGAPMPEAKQPDNRLTPHQNIVLSNMRLQVVYVGDEGIDGSLSFDTFIAWLLTSTDYWVALLAQYGVGKGAFQGSVRIPTSVFFPPGLVQGGLISGEALDARIQELLQPPAPAPPDAGTDAMADAMTEAGADAPADATVAPILIPPSDAYIFFLPAGVNVIDAGYQTCIDIGGYHDVQSPKPYAVIPLCSGGANTLAVSHELAEMATDPTGSGWFSDKDIANSGGEIGDLCNHPAPTLDGWTVTQLWSNKDGDCEPQ